MSNSLGLKLAIGGAVASSFSNAISGTKDKINSLVEQLKSVSKVRVNIKELISLAEQGLQGEETYKKLEDQLKLAGIETTNLCYSLEAVNKELVKLKKTARIDLNIDNARKKLTSLKTELKSTAKHWAAITATLYVNADLKQAQGEVAALGVSTEGIEKLSKSAHLFSNQWAGVAAPEFLRASHTIKTNIANLTDESISEFTRMAALTGIATKLSVEESTTLITEHYSKFRKEFATDEEYAKSFSNAFSTAAKSFNISGSDLAASMNAIGIDATHMGVGLKEQLAVLGSAKSVMGNTSDAVKGYKSILANASQAQEVLGIQFTDSYGHMLPMSDILYELESIFGSLESSEMKDALKHAFGNDDAAKLLSAMVGKSGELKEAYSMLNDEIKAGTITETMAEAMQSGKEFTLMKQQIQNLTASIGGLFYPAFKIAAHVIGFVVTGITNFIEHNKKLCTVIATVAAALLTYKTIAIGTKMAITSIHIASMLYTKAMILQSGTIKGITIATKLWGLATKVVTMIMAANPIGLALTAIAVVIALIVFNWDKVKNGFLYLISILKGKLIPIFNILRPVSITVIGNMIKGFNSLKSIILSVSTWIKDKFVSVWEAVGERVRKIIDAINEKVGWVLDKIDAVKNKAKSVANFFGLGDEQESDKTDNSNIDIKPNNKEIQQAFSQNSQSAYKNNEFNITLGNINVTSTDGILQPESLNTQLISAVKNALKQIEWQTNNRRVADI